MEQNKPKTSIGDDIRFVSLLACFKPENFQKSLDASIFRCFTISVVFGDNKNAFEL